MLPLILVSDSVRGRVEGESVLGEEGVGREGGVLEPWGREGGVREPPRELRPGEEEV